MAQWKVVGVEPFRGENYIKMERVDLDQASPFAKKQANVSAAQVRAIFEAMGVLELEEFAGVSAK